MSGEYPPTDSTATDQGSDPWDALPLEQRHVAHLKAAGISVDVAKVRGYETLATQAAIRRRGFGDTQARTAPALLIPQWSPGGELAGYAIRPDTPRVDAKNRPIKYETPPKSTPGLDVTPAARDWVMDPFRALWIVEGSKKADAAASRGIACVSVAGVSSWRTPEAIAGIDLIPWKGRSVYLAFDSDWRRNSTVRRELCRLGRVLTLRGSTVLYVDLPEPSSGVKVGLDDYFAAGGTELDLLNRHVSDAPPEAGEQDDATGPYAVIDGAICFRKKDRDGEMWVRLCNFAARVAEEVTADDGQSERGELVIVGSLSDGTPLAPARVPLSRFEGLGWVVAEWGTRAVVTAGMGAKDRLREAIQLLSPDVARRREYTHPGWRHLDGQGWVYLHGGGAIGSNGPVAGVCIRLAGSAARIALPDPSDTEAVRSAVRVALTARDVAPDRITAPLLAMAYRAVLNAVSYADLVGFVVGPTGVLKSELAALVQRHFGSGFARLALPAQWSATANALERLAFDYKDAALVIDDFAPAGSPHDVARCHATAERVIRGAGNAGGRGRMARDGTVHPDYPPRALIVATGEDLPTGQSIRARAVVVEVDKGDVDPARLRALQEGPGRTAPALAMAGFVRWLAPRIDAIEAGLPAMLAELRSAIVAERLHARTPDALANLAAGWRYWLRYAVDCGALLPAEGEAAWARAWAALSALASDQSGHQAGEEPAARFLSLLGSAIARGDAHVAGAAESVPEHAAAWGWRLVTMGSGGYAREEWRPAMPSSPCVGWIDGNDLYLDLDSAYAAAQRLGGLTGGGLTVKPVTLTKRLHQSGRLRSTEHDGRGELRVRRTIAGMRRRVLHLSADDLAPQESAQSAQSRVGRPSQSTDAGGNGRTAWAEESDADANVAHESRPPGAATGTNAAGNGRVGRNGRVFSEGGAATRNAATEGVMNLVGTHQTELLLDVPAITGMQRQGDSGRSWVCGCGANVGGERLGCPFCGAACPAPMVDCHDTVSQD